MAGSIRVTLPTPLPRGACAGEGDLPHLPTLPSVELSRPKEWEGSLRGGQHGPSPATILMSLSNQSRLSCSS